MCFFHVNAKGLDKFQNKKKLPYDQYREIILKTIKNVKESVKLGFFHFTVRFYFRFMPFSLTMSMNLSVNETISLNIWNLKTAK